MLFNWFKNKLNNVIPKDIDNSMMTSNITHKMLKYGTKLTVPNGVLCFVSFKDKIYDVLENGNHIFDSELLPKLFDKQKNKITGKLKKFQLDLDFVNTAKFTNILSYITKVPVENKKTKVTFIISVNINVIDAKTFHNYILRNVTFTDAEKTNSIFNYFVEEFTRYHFKKLVLDQLSLGYDTMAEYQEQLNKHLQKIGVKLNSVNLNVVATDKKMKIQKKVEKSDFFSDFNNRNKNIISEYDDTIDLTRLSDLGKNDQNSINKNDLNTRLPNVSDLPSSKNLPSIHNVSGGAHLQKVAEIISKAPHEEEKPIDNSEYCPRCQNKILKNSKFCHKCGQQLE